MATNPTILLLLRLIGLVEDLIYAYTWVIIIAVVMSWLVAFGIVNPYNRFARAVVAFLDALTEPVFRMARRVIPAMGGLDLSPLIVLIALQIATFLLNYVAESLVYGR